jgi:hypothetical protein
MALRLLEIVVPEEVTGDVLKIIEAAKVTNYWLTCSCENRNIVKMIVTAEKTENLLDTFEKKYGGLEDFHMVLLPLEASYPGTKEIEERAEEGKEAAEGERKKEPLRVSRQELYHDVFDSSKLTNTYMIMIVLSAIVAAIGLIKDNVAVIIGAMVIAPLLGPNVALSFATTVGDGELGRNALKTKYYRHIYCLCGFIGSGIFSGHRAWHQRNCITNRYKLCGHNPCSCLGGCGGLIRYKRCAFSIDRGHGLSGPDTAPCCFWPAAGFGEFSACSPGHGTGSH